MCTCDKPNVNGQLGYKWQPDDEPGTRQVNPPATEDGDTILFDLPGRCGRGCDSHSYHFMVVERNHGEIWLLARHGRGDEGYKIGRNYEHHRDAILQVIEAANGNDRNERYWFLQNLYQTMHAIKCEARDNERDRWKTAARQGRLKLRSRKGVPFAEIIGE